MLTKKCITCGKKFIKPVNESRKNWKYRHKFCSVICVDKWKKGKHFSLNTEFRKGQKAINPIRKGEHKGRKTEFQKGYSPHNKGKKMSAEKYEKLKNAGFFNPKFGKDSGNWKGGTTRLKVAIMGLKKYKEWRRAVFQRDNYICQKCKAQTEKGRKVYLQAHHKNSFCQIVIENKIKTTKDALNCKELWDISNGQTLCIFCHRQTNSYLVNQHTMTAA